MGLERYTKLGFVVSGHLAAYALVAKPAESGDASATVSLAILSVLVLGLGLFHELTPQTAE